MSVSNDFLKTQSLSFVQNKAYIPAESTEPAQKMTSTLSPPKKSVVPSQPSPTSDNRHGTHLGRPLSTPLSPSPQPTLPRSRRRRSVTPLPPLETLGIDSSASPFEGDTETNRNSKISQTGGEQERTDCGSSQTNAQVHMKVPSVSPTACKPKTPDLPASPPARNELVSTGKTGEESLESASKYKDDDDDNSEYMTMSSLPSILLKAQMANSLPQASGYGFPSSPHSPAHPLSDLVEEHKPCGLSDGITPVHTTQNCSPGPHVRAGTIYSDQVSSVPVKGQTAISRTKSPVQRLRSSSFSGIHGGATLVTTRRRRRTPQKPDETPSLKEAEESRASIPLFKKQAEDLGGPPFPDPRPRSMTEKPQPWLRRHLSLDFGRNFSTPLVRVSIDGFGKEKHAVTEEEFKSSSLDDSLKFSTKD